MTVYAILVCDPDIAVRKYLQCINKNSEMAKQEATLSYLNMLGYVLKNCIQRFSKLRSFDIIARSASLRVWAVIKNDKSFTPSLYSD